MAIYSISGVTTCTRTSGGLLLSLPAAQADDLLTALKDKGLAAAIKIGEVVDEPVGITLI